MIIGVTGQMKAGKDTVCDYLESAYGFKKVGFAEKLYEAVAALFGVPLDEAYAWKEGDIRVEVVDAPNKVVKRVLTYREFLQHMGTEVGREVFDGNFWVHQLAKKLYVNENYCVRDVRFKNEAMALTSLSGVIWRIRRPGYGGDAHKSETEMNEIHADIELMNGGTLEVLYETIDEVMKSYGYSRRDAT